MQKKASDARGIGVPPVVGMRLGSVSPARVPEASGWETRFFCSMKRAGSSRVLWFSFRDECRSGNSALLIAVAACYVQCSSGAAMALDRSRMTGFSESYENYDSIL